MAVKAISQLEEFDNKIDLTSYFEIVGGELHMFVNSPEDPILAANDKSSDPAPSSSSTDKSKAPELKPNSDAFYGSLFEISKPANRGQKGMPTSNKVYTSQKITYLDLARNIILDTKNYLNTRNNLGNFNLRAIVLDDYVFEGNKTFKNDVYVNQTLTAQNLTATNELATNLTATNEYVNHLTVNNSFRISCDVHAEGKTIYLEDNAGRGFLNGYAYGLKDDLLTKTTCGTYDKTFSNGLRDTENRTGDPVMFKAGRPYELTCVNCATSSYNIVDQDGNGLNIGYGDTEKNRSSWNDPRPDDPEYSYAAVWFENGIPKATNIIDYACHAFWSDLGEKYLGDCDLEPGTLVQFGGDKEITVAKDKVNAIVSTRAFDLNHDLEGGTVIALCGRVPTKVIGKVKKFDDIVLSKIPGVGRSKRWYDFFKKPIGKALEGNDDENIKLVECVTRFII